MLRIRGNLKHYSAIAVWIDVYMSAQRQTTQKEEATNKVKFLVINIP